jgi:hypothetical protein
MEDGPANRSREVVATLERLGPEVERLTNPSEAGRGRVAFAALGGDWVVRLESQMPVPNRVVLDDGPFVHPLLELLDEGQPADVVMVSPDDARLLEWRLARLRESGLLVKPSLDSLSLRAVAHQWGQPAESGRAGLRRRRRKVRWRLDQDRAAPTHAFGVGASDVLPPKV